MAEKLEIEVLEIDAEADHVHISVAYPPKCLVTIMVNVLKSISSHYMLILNTYLYKTSNSAVRWSRSYFVCNTGGTTIKTLRSYV